MPRRNGADLNEFRRRLAYNAHDMPFIRPLMRSLCAAFALAIAASSAFAQRAPVIVIPGRPDVPVYIHPAYPHPAVVEAYYKDYLGAYPNLATAGWGFGVETATQGIRFVLSGVFEKYPKLQIILGHMGEGLPFYIWRINQALSRHGNAGENARKSFRDVFAEHFYITTSGFFSDAALQCCITELGIDRVMFSIDYPFVPNPPGTSWIKPLQMNAADKEKILSGNAKRLLKI